MTVWHIKVNSNAISKTIKINFPITYSKEIIIKSESVGPNMKLA